MPRSMVTEPALILADEPTANLYSATAIVRFDVMEHLNRATGTTFIFSTHDPLVLERGSPFDLLAGRSNCERRDARWADDQRGQTIEKFVI